MPSQGAQPSPEVFCTLVQKSLSSRQYQGTKGTLIKGQAAATVYELAILSSWKVGSFPKDALKFLMCRTTRFDPSSRLYTRGTRSICSNLSFRASTVDSSYGCNLDRSRPSSAVQPRLPLTR